MILEGLSEMDVLLILIVAPNIFLPWIGIVKAALTRPDDYTVWPAISLYYALISFTAIFLISLSGMLTSINPIVGLSSIIAFTSTVSAMILVLLSEKIGDRFIEELPKPSLQTKKNERIQMKIYEPYIYYYETSKNEPHSRPTEQRASQHAPVEAPSSKKTIQEKPPSQNTVRVDGQTIMDKGYMKYLRWCEENYRRHDKLTYTEFLKTREAASKILPRILDGDYEIGVPELSILARISLREDLRNNARWAEAIKKLNKSGLVSRNHKLMPRGVKIVKALKEAGLLEKIGEQTKP